MSSMVQKWRLNLRIRKNQSALTDTEKRNFVNALLELKDNGTYDQYVKIHIDAMAHASPTGGEPSFRNAAHNGPAFLPWHREFLRRFELELHDIDSSVTLPYWDWTVDNSATSSIWNNDFMGGDGQGVNNIVQDGPFTGNNWRLHDGSALRRTLGRSPFLRPRRGSDLLPLPTLEQVNDCLDVTPYDSDPWSRSSNENTSFRNRLEGWVSEGTGQIHNRVHVWVGGSMMADSSPNDPVFFLHHCNVDRLWAIWQNNHPNEGYLPVSGGPEQHNLNDPMFPWEKTTTPASVLNYRSLGYTYWGCMIATAAYGSELAPPVQFLRGFRDNVVLKSRYRKIFEEPLRVYYSVSPPIANYMIQNKPFKYVMKYTVVWPFVIVAKISAHLIELFLDKEK